MHLTRHFPLNFESLRSLVHQACGASDKVMMQAGHFLLYHDPKTDLILPCIPEALTDPRHSEIREEYAQFPLLSWELGLRLLDSLPGGRKQVMTVVNDWQYLPKKSNRADFYASHGELPLSYRAELSRHADSISLFTPKKSRARDTPFFGEMNLRNRYQRHVSKLITDKKLPPTAVLKSSHESLSCSLPDMVGGQKEVYCTGKTGDCAGEIAEMIYEASSRGGAACMINLYPLVCREFVEFGSQLAVELLGSTCKTILNLGFQATSIHGSDEMIGTTEATLHQWNK